MVSNVAAPRTAKRACHVHLYVAAQSNIDAQFNGQKLARVKSTNAKRVLISAMQVGFADAVRGLSYAAAYDCADREWQTNYERGRLACANIRAAGLPLPVWKKGQPPSDAFARAYKISKKLTGRATPGQPLPASAA